LGSLFLKAREEISTNWIDNAKYYLEKALEINPESKKANYQMGKLYYLLRNDAQEEGEEKYVDSAIKFFSKGGRDAWSMYRLGIIYEEKGKYELAIAKLRRAIDMKPNFRHAIKLYIISVVHYLNHQQNQFSSKEKNLAEHAKKLTITHFENSQDGDQAEFALRILSELKIIKKKWQSTVINTNSTSKDET